METMYYTVWRIDGDYAWLKRTDADYEPLLVARALLPDEIERIRNGSATPYTGTAATKPISAFKIEKNRNTSSYNNRTSSSAVTAAAVASGYYVQFGAYQDIGNARVHLNRYSRLWSSSYPAIKTVPHGGLYKLMAGPFSTKEEASLARQEMLDRGIDGFVVRK